MTINDIILYHVQYTTTITSGFLPYWYILLFTQAPILVLWLDGTIIDIIISTILVNMYYYIQWLCWVMIGDCAWMVINIGVQYNGGFLPDIILLTQGYYVPSSLGNPVRYHVVALYS